jgi:hypothetical protein
LTGGLAARTCHATPAEAAASSRLAAASCGTVNEMRGRRRIIGAAVIGCARDGDVVPVAIAGHRSDAGSVAGRLRAAATTRRRSFNVRVHSAQAARCDSSASRSPGDSSSSR